MSDLDEEELQDLYAWIDGIPLTRQKKNIARDFSDGVLAAEVVNHFLPKYVDLHNYSPANANHQKMENWRTLNRKVFYRLDFSIQEKFLQGAASGKQGVIEYILTTLRAKIESHVKMRATKNFSDEDFFAPPQLDHYNPSKMVTNYQAGPGSPSLYGGDRHADSVDNGMSRTYPTSYPGKFSRIPKRKTQQLNSPRAHDQKIMLPPIEQQNFYRKPPPPAIRSKRRENYEKYELRLAEKDQKLLEAHECIQYLQMKLTRYEHLVHIKDMKIEALKKELEEARTKPGGLKQTIHYQRR